MSGLIGSPPAPTLRKDLQFQWVDGPSREEGYWVVHDPLATQWYCLSDDEYRLLRLASKSQTLGELCSQAIELLRPKRTTAEALIQFYRQAIHQGFLLEKGVRTLFHQDSAPKRVLTPFSVLAYRLPGFNPMRMAVVLDPIARLISRPAVVFVYLGLLATAALTLFSQSDRLFNQLSETAGGLLNGTIMGPHGWIAVLLVIATAKTIHELAHVIACRLAGAECRQLGIMMLLGTPCLYCDVSDLWHVASRRKRVLVSAAGMLAELGIAAIAALIWSVTDRSVSNDIALLLIMVCSISTVLVNANPLLRYDGYFMLSDWLGIPNLASRSSEMVRRGIRRLVWGASASQEMAATPIQLGRRISPIWIGFFGVLSGIYRLTILGLIILMIYHASDPWGLAWLAILFALALAISLMHRWWHSVMRVPPTDGPSKWWNHRRPLLAVTLTLGLVAAIVFIPLPRQLCLPVLLVGADQREVFSTQTGRLVSNSESGTKVATGDVLVQLAKNSLSEQNAMAKSEVAIANAVLEVARASRRADPASSELIALSEKRVQAADQLQTQVQTAFDELSVRAPQSGVWISRSSDLHPAQELLPGQRIDAGTSLGWVMPTRQFEAVGYASAIQLDDLQVGQTVVLSHPSLSRRSFLGRVREIQQISRPAMPLELTSVKVGGQASTVSSSSERDSPRYQVQIEWIEQPSRPSLVHRSVALAWVRVAPKSLMARFIDWLATQRRGQ